MKKKIPLVLLAILIVIQFLPIKTENPDFDPNSDFLSTIGNENSSEAKLIKAACYDCHSNQTVYPSYTRVQPIGFFLRSHIRGGRQKLNFSNWKEYTIKKQTHKLEECAEVLEDKRMPMKSYTFLHPEAKLSTDDRERLIAFFSNQ